jgi:hypothetical protein
VPLVRDEARKAEPVGGREVLHEVPVRVDGSVRLAAGSAKAREALAQYVPRPTAGQGPARGVRPPLSLQKLLVAEAGTDTVIYRAPYSDYFKTASIPTTPLSLRGSYHSPPPCTPTRGRHGSPVLAIRSRSEP